MPRNEAEQRHECADIASKGMNLEYGKAGTHVCGFVGVRYIMFMGITRTG